MCRYAVKNYKSHFACFSCRKAFKKTPLSDYVVHKGLDTALAKIMRVYHTPPRRLEVEAEIGISYEQIVDQYLKDVSVCPECAGPMAAMGLDFRPPARADEDAWQIIAVLYEHGFAFKGCGCGGLGYAPPQRQRDLPEWLKQHCRQSEGEKLLEKFSQRSA